MELHSQKRGILQGTDLPNGEHNGQRAMFQDKIRSEVKGDRSLGFGDPDEGKGWMTGEGPRPGFMWVSRATFELKDLWMPPPDREAKLEVVRSGSSYDIRAYKGERKPSRLYDDEDDELRYKIAPEDVPLEKAQELEDERREIIRSQAVRKSTTVAEKGGSAEQLGPSPGTDETQAGRSYSTGFAVCFDGSPPSRRSTPVDPQNVDTEQIDFAAARRQFLELEKMNPQLLLGNKQAVPAPHGPQTARSVYRGDEYQGPVIHKETPLSDTHNQGGLGGSRERTDLLVWQGEGPVSRGQDPAGEILGRLPQDARVSRRHSGDPLDPVASGPDPSGEMETPIEREIRLSWEREEDHWRERGIPRVIVREELVEIHTRPLLSAAVSSPPPASSGKGKEKSLVSFCIQREVEQETQREEALQREGRLLGAYDKGTRRGLAERRKVFERDPGAPQASPGRAKDLGEPQEPLNGEGPPASSGFAPWRHDGDGTEDGRRSSEVISLPLSAPRTGQARLGKEETRSSWRSATSHRQMDPRGLRHPSPKGSENPAEELAVLRKEHFAIPVQKLRFSFSGDLEPPKARREERQPASGAPREELYTLKTWRPRTSALIDREIQEALERELELQEQRRKAGLGSEAAPASRFSSQSSGMPREREKMARVAPDPAAATACHTLVPNWATVSWEWALSRRPCSLGEALLTILLAGI